LVKITDTGFGYIVVDDKKYDEDIVICRDKVFKRPKHLSKKYREIYRHTPLSIDELKYILELCRDIKIIVIGKGQNGALPIPDEVLDFLDKGGYKVYIDITPKAVDYVNGLSSKNNEYLAILHITC